MARFVLAKKRHRRGPLQETRDGSPRWQDVLDILGPTVVPLNDPVTPEGQDVRILVVEADAKEYVETRPVFLRQFE